MNPISSMTGQRSYRGPRPWHALVKELRQVSGSQLDPFVIDAFFTAEEQIHDWLLGGDALSGFLETAPAKDGKVFLKKRTTSVIPSSIESSTEDRNDTQRAFNTECQRNRNYTGKTAGSYRPTWQECGTTMPGPRAIAMDKTTPLETDSTGDH